MGDKISKLLIGVFLAAVIVNIIKWLAVFVVRFIWKTSVISFKKAINKTIHFKCTDEAVQFLVKIEVLFSITEATLYKHNKGEKYSIVFIK